MIGETPGQRSGRDDDAAAGSRAAECLYRDWQPNEIDDIPTVAYANAAICRLADLMESAPEAEKESRRGAERGAESLTARPYQGLLEQMQNADDLGATALRIGIQGDDLLLAHDGQRVKVAHVVAMLFPWLTTKANDSTASGRFGIGQRTLGVLGSPIHVHCEPWHFVIDAHGPRICEAASPISGFYDPTRPDTLLVLPLLPSVDREALSNFVRDLGPNVLLFLSSVHRLTFTDLNANFTVADYKLRIERSVLTSVEIGGRALQAEQITLADASSGDRFSRYTVDRPLGDNEQRQHKATGPSSILSLAIPDKHRSLGGFYDRLPLPIQSNFPFCLSAQFDPDAARNTLLPRPWNEDRLKDLGDLIASAALDRFSGDPQDGWWSVPLIGELPTEGDEWVQTHMRTSIVLAVQSHIAGRLELPVGQVRRPLSEFVYEESALEGLLRPEDQTYLMPDCHAIPLTTRDKEGRWRNVLGELGRTRMITVADALALLDRSDQELGPHDPDWYVRFAAAALDAQLLWKLLEKRALLLADGRRVTAPARGDPQSLVSRLDKDSLAAKLGLAIEIHPRYLSGDDEDARRVAAALRQEGVLSDQVDSAEAALNALAREDNRECVQLSDEQLIALRNAFEVLDDDQQRLLGPRIGRNIKLRGRTFDELGDPHETWVAPAGAYLPARIDRGEADNFARAANATPGLYWIDGTYDRVLKRSGGRRELGAQRFLTRLGVMTAPRLTRAEDEVKVYQRDPRHVSPLSATARPPIQLFEIQGLPTAAGHLMDDAWSPDLDAVIRDIRADRNRPRRRRRSLALLSVLARAWDRVYADRQYASAVWASDGHWHECGQVTATWLAKAATEPWLLDGAHRLQAPADLYLPTDANRLAYGNERHKYLASVPDSVLRSPALVALHVRSGPSARSLVEFLESSRDEATDSVDDNKIRTAYQLLALKCPPPDVRGQLVDDITSKELRARFDGGEGLIRISARWYRPSQVFSSRPIFGRWRPFVPSTSDMEPLWRTLAIRAPGTHDCILVLNDIAKTPLTQEALPIVLEIMRVLADSSDSMPPELKTQLRSVPLWTGVKWTTARPVYAIEDQAVASQIATTVPIWRSGFSSLSEVRKILEPLGVTEIQADDFTPVAVDQTDATGGEDLRDRFAAATVHLSNELITGDTPLYNSLKVPWENLRTAQVIIHRDLQLALTLRNRKQVTVSADAHMRTAPLMFIVRSSEAAGSAEIGGRAIASLFSGDRQKVGWAWAEMWRRAGEGILPDELTLPGATKQGREPAQALLQLKTQAARRGRQDQIESGGKPSSSGGLAVVVKRLKDISNLEPDDGTLINRGSVKRGRMPPQDTPLTRIDTLIGPRGAADAGGGSRGTPTVLPPMSDREQLAFDAVLRALQADPRLVADVRKRHGIGADAIDDLHQLFEIKMASGADIPDEVTLTPSEARRAQEERDFFLVVVSGLEEMSGVLRVRFIFDPLNRLTVRSKGDLTLSGVRDAEAMEFVFRTGGTKVSPPG